jgi:hypothetical protein
MWLIRIDEKGWLSQARSHTLNAINCCRPSLRYDRNVFNIAASCGMTLKIDHRASTMLSSLQYMSSRAIRAFTIVARSLVMLQKKFGWLLLA